MNIETLQYFHYIAKYKNITNAAKHLYISQSTLSRHIMALENELGVKLFERNNKQIELTAAGRAFYKDSGSFISHMEKVIQNAQAADKGHAGVLRVTLPSRLHPVLTGPLAAMKEKHPGIRLILESYTFDEIPSAIQYDLYNVGFSYDFACPEQEEVAQVPVGTDDFSLAIPAAFARPEPQEAIAGVVRALPFILPSHIEPPFLKRFLSVFQDYAGTKILSTTNVNTSESAMLNTALGLGYSIVPSTWARCEKGTLGVEYIDLLDLPTKCEIVMLYKASDATEATKHFVNIVREQAGDITF